MADIQDDKGASDARISNYCKTSRSVGYSTNRTAAKRNHHKSHHGGGVDVLDIIKMSVFWAKSACSGYSAFGIYPLASAAPPSLEEGAWEEHLPLSDIICW